MRFIQRSGKYHGFVRHFRSGADVTFHVYSSKKEERRLRSILNKWADRGYVGNITISEKDTTLRSLLSLESLAINQEGIIRENDEFILSCVARGSPTMSFRWFKDGIPINVTSTSRKWIKLIKDPHVADQYTALLAIESAHIYDGGLFTCQIEDFNIQQCLSRAVEIGKRPVVNIEPMSITVRKGGNFTVKCVTVDENGDKFTYSWTKNKELLPVRTENEKYEILYPTGTILQVNNAETVSGYSKDACAG
nr:hemicentin-1-like [Leptinotarsa decemlineata]